MRKLRTATFVSLDGVMQAPGGPTEDRRRGFRFGGWVFPCFDEKLGSLMHRAMGENYDLLLGRRTYEIFAAFWPSQDDEIDRTFNAVNKYVAASPDTPLDWVHSHRLEGDLVEALRALKATEGRDLLIQGSSEVIPQPAGPRPDRPADRPDLPDGAGEGHAAVRRGLASACLDAGEQRHVRDRRHCRDIPSRRRGEERLVRR